MYENCSGGLLDALVIVTVHACTIYCILYNMRCSGLQLFYGKWFVFDRSLYKEAEEQWESAHVMTDKSITEKDKHK